MKEEELKLVEQLSALFFEPLDIAIILGAEPDGFLLDCGMSNTQIKRIKNAYPNTSIALAIAKGRLKQEMEIRKSIFEMAEQGSSPAQQQVMRIIEKAQIRKKTEKR